MKKLLLKASISILPLLIFSGCALSQQPKDNYFTSKINDNSKLTDSESIVLANDFSMFIHEYYLPSKTKFYINTEDINSTFFKTIDSKLRSKGYGLTFDNEAKDINFLSWQISELEPKVIRVTYNIDTSRVTKMYKRNEDNIISYGSFTAINLKESVNQIELPNLNSIEEIQPEIETPPILTAKVRASALRIRATPSLRGKIIGRFIKGSVVAIEYVTTVNNYEWAKLSDQDGYISNKKAYLRY